jgi:hypothetical protein
MTKKRAVYYSWNAVEHARLAGATHDEIVLYLTVLKPLADFKTGIVGTFAPKQPLTYTRLGELLGRPKTQGRSAIKYDGTQAKRVLQGLEARGLVCETVQVGGALIVRLPLSPIATTQNTGKLSGELPGQTSGNPATARGFSEIRPLPTVLTNIEHIDHSRREKPNIEHAEQILEVECGAEVVAQTEGIADDDDFMPFDDTPPHWTGRGAVAI